MKRDDWAMWLVPGKVGRVTAIHPITRQVDLAFPDGSTRGHIPMVEVVPAEDPGPQPFDPGAVIDPEGIDSREGFGRL
jgi:hypothetical protein